MIKLCIVGAGRMAVEHLKVFSEIKNIELSGISTRTKKKAKILQKKYPTLKIYHNLEEMFTTEKPEGAIVAVNENVLLKICKKIFKFDSSLLIEKPIGCDFNQNLKIIKLMKKYKKKNCFVALNRRQYHSTKSLLKLLKKDKTKRKIYINDQQFNLKKYYPHKANIVLKNMMFANSIHLLDYVNVLSRGKIVSILTRISRQKRDISFVASTIKFSTGDIVYYKAIWNSFSKWGIRIFTNNYFYEMNPIEKLQYFNFKSLNKTIIKNSLNDIKFKPGFMEQAINFIKMIKKKPHSLVNINDNFNTTKIIKKIYENF